MAKQRKLKAGHIGNIFRAEFNIIRLMDNRLISSTIEFSAELVVSDSAEANDQIKALGSMRRWIDGVVSGSVAFCPSSDDPPPSLQTLQNNFMFTPDEPYDHLLMVLICAKLNAIGAGIVQVNHCQLISDLGDGFGNWFEGNTDDALPTLGEWLGDRTYFDKPWWNRPDGSMIDIWAGPEDDIKKKPDILLNLWPEDLEDYQITDHQTEPAEIIKHNFKPTIIKDE